jgi:hypothetical protein
MAIPRESQVRPQILMGACNQEKEFQNWIRPSQTIHNPASHIQNIPLPLEIPRSAGLPGSPGKDLAVQRCRWIAVKKGGLRPPGGPPGLQSAIASFGQC